MRRRFIPISWRSALGAAAIVVVLASIGGGGYALFFGGSSGPAASVNSVNLSKGLVGWWRMDGNAKDSTPYGNNGTVNGATLTTDRKGRANSAYAFNGSSDVEVSSGGAGGTFTVSIWAEPTQTTGLLGMVGSRGGPTFDMKLASGVIHGDIGNGSSWITTTADASYTWTTGIWYNIVYAVTPTSYTIYANGVQVGSGAYASNTPLLYNAANPLTIGSDGPGVGEYFVGSLDDARIYNRALSASEVTALYKQYSPSPKAAQGENGLVGWWKLNGNAKDSTPYGNNGTVNGATLTTGRKGRPNSAYSFNGTSNYIGLTNNSNFQLSTGTLSAWVNTTASCPAFCGIVVKWHAYGLFDYNGQLITYDWGTSSPRSSGVNINDGKWHQVAVSFQSGVTNGTIIYVDGVARATTTITISDQGESLAIASGQSGTGQYIPGSISSVRLYNKILTASQIAAQYNSYNSQICLGGCGQGINLQKGLVGYWPMDGNAKDATPYSNNGTVNGATLTTDRKGRPNSAYSFNGNGTNYIDLGNNVPSLTSGDFTVGLWANTSTGGSNAAAFSQGIPSTWANNLFILYYGDTAAAAGGVRVWWNGTVLTYAISVIDGKWHYVTLTRTGSTLSLYIDGVQMATGTASGSWSSTSTTIGAENDNGGMVQGFSGLLDDVRIYNRALSASEIQALYSSYQ